ncbi:MAG: FliM/FliN family flagellar motor switch protein [Planctomycetales bacterium]|nr:FliM/FliN family flagellar motor switch protein [Planctomycetales bacterium]
MHTSSDGSDRESAGREPTAAGARVFAFPNWEDPAAEVGQRSRSLRIVIGTASGDELRANSGLANSLLANDVIELNEQVAAPVEVFDGERLMARGELVMLDGTFGVRVTELNPNRQPRMDRSLRRAS